MIPKFLRFSIVLGGLLACSALPVGAQSGTLKGTLSSSDGSTIEGIRVTAIYADDGAGRFADSVLTDAQGRFVIGPLPSGRYYIYAGSPQYPIYFPGVILNSAARAVTVGSRTSAEGLDFTIHRVGVTVSGKLVMGNIYAPIVVTMNGNGLNRETSPGNGRAFEFPGVMPGTYTISAPSDLKLEPVRVTVKSEDIQDLVLKSESLKLYHVRGKVTQANPDHPMSRAPDTVMLTGSIPNSVFVPPASIQPDGSFDFPNVPPGHYEVSAVVLDSPTLGIDVKDSDVTGAALVLTTSIPMTIKVRMDDGKLPEFENRQGLYLEIAADSGVAHTGFRNTSTIEDSITAGKGYVFVTPTAGYFVTSMRSGTIDLFRSPLDISPASEHVTIDVTLSRKRPVGQPPATVKGRLTGGQIGIPLTLTSTARSLSDPPDYIAYTSRDGTFEFPDVGFGRYNLDVSRYGTLKRKIIVIGKDIDIRDVEVPAGSIINVMFMGTDNPRSGFPEHMSVRFQNGPDSHSVAVSVNPNSAVYALPSGQYRVSVEGMSEGFFVKTMVADGVDLLSSPLVISANPRSIPLIQFLVSFKEPSP